MTNIFLHNETDKIGKKNQDLEREHPAIRRRQQYNYCVKVEGISFSPEFPKFTNQKQLRIKKGHFYSIISPNFPSKSFGDWASAIWSGSQLKNINNSMKFILKLGFMV